MIPTPKYDIGDKVFSPDAFSEWRLHPCPDCNGTKEWKVITAAGEMTAECGRCCSRFFDHKIPDLRYQFYVPEVRERTIGSVRVDTADRESQVSYMCVETGVGSGNVYKEDDLAGDRETARSMAEQKARVLNAKVSAEPHAMVGAWYAKLNLREAWGEEIRSGLWHSWNRYHALRDEMSELADDQTIDDVVDIRDEIKSKLAWDENHRTASPVFSKLVHAAQNAAEKYGDGELAAALKMIPAFKKEVA